MRKAWRAQPAIGLRSIVGPLKDIRSCPAGDLSLIPPRRLVELRPPSSNGNSRQEIHLSVAQRGPDEAITFQLARAGAAPDSMLWAADRCHTDTAEIVTGLLAVPRINAR
jgi:hypothetical protein